MRHRLASLAAALLGLAAFSFHALPQSYPSKPLRFIVPDSPGSVGDLRARQIGAQLSEAMGQPVVIDNRPGASQMIGAEAGARSAPDGYTLFLGSIVTHSLNPLLYKTMSYRPEDLMPVTAVSAGPALLVVNAQLPPRSVRELVDFAAGRPEPLAYGVVGRGTPGHMIMEQLKAASGANFLAVPYKATATLLQDVVAGHLPMGFNFWSIIGTSVKSGKLRALAVAGPRRLEVAPDVPTFAEAGYPGIDGRAWQGIFVPRGTPAPVVERLHGELVRIINLPVVKNPIIDTGGEVGGNAQVEFAAFIEADRIKWKAIADRIGLLPE